MKSTTRRLSLRALRASARPAAPPPPGASTCRIAARRLRPRRRWNHRLAIGSSISGCPLCLFLAQPLFPGHRENRVLEQHAARAPWHAFSVQPLAVIRMTVVMRARERTHDVTVRVHLVKAVPKLKRTRKLVLRRRISTELRAAWAMGQPLPDRGQAATSRRRGHPRLAPVNAARANGGTRGREWRRRDPRGSTCRIVAKRLRRQTTPVPLWAHDHHLSDRGHAATPHHPRAHVARAKPEPRGQPHYVVRGKRIAFPGSVTRGGRVTLHSDSSSIFSRHHSRPGHRRRQTFRRHSRRGHRRLVLPAASLHSR